MTALLQRSEDSCKIPAFIFFLHDLGVWIFPLFVPPLHPRHPPASPPLPPDEFLIWLEIISLQPWRMCRIRTVSYCVWKFSQGLILGEREREPGLAHFTGRFLVSPGRLHLLCLVCAQHKLFHWEFSAGLRSSCLCQSRMNHSSIWPPLLQRNPKLIRIPVIIRKRKFTNWIWIEFHLHENLNFVYFFFLVRLTSEGQRILLNVEQKKKKKETFQGHFPENCFLLFSEKWFLAS